ncbi:helix-turn-helix domain-containing protein [Elizabethkingia anophelis]|uniref:AlbA family DNA-binding domain-containing protein n=1 Tax=Elizabethkingia anophelis TaxID=1117645 RepID=UPI0029216E0F|nr:MAG: hypothetical protein PQ275_19860 [Elizabethkingia anophelis]
MEVIFNLIENECENTRLDFKQEQYPLDKKDARKSEFLKDMCAFANLLSEEDKYIIIGVVEDSGKAIGYKSIEKINDQASYQEYLNQYIEPEINFEYIQIPYNGYQLACFRLYNNNQYPYLFKKEFKENNGRGAHYREGMGFIRSGSSTRLLKRDDFEKIYKVRFGEKDYSKDVGFTIFLKTFNSEYLKEGRCLHLEINSINNANKSVELDVDVKIYKSNGCNVGLASDIKVRLAEKFEIGKKNKADYMSNFIVSQVYFDNSVEFYKTLDYSLFERTSSTGVGPAIRIKQGGELKDIFNGQIALEILTPTDIKIEIIARCNDFPNGPVIREYIISKLEIERFFSI